MASLWRPGGPLGALGTMGSTRKDTLRSRLRFLLIFGRVRDLILKAFWVPWTNKCVCVVMLVSRFFFEWFSGLNLDI